MAADGSADGAPDRAGQGRLVAIVVTYNRLDALRQTLGRLLESDADTLAQVIVADNASSDGTAAWLAAQKDPRLTVLSAPRNEGGAGGFARAMAHAMAHCAPDWLVLMDDDGRPCPGALERFHTLDAQGWDALAAAVYFPDGRICEMNRPSRNPFWHGRVFLRTGLQLGGRSGFHIDPGAYRGTEPKPIDITSFVGFFVRAEAVRRVGYPDARLFVYGDDGLYALALRKAGGRIAFQPALRFEHDLKTFAGPGAGPEAEAAAAAQNGRFRPLWKAYYYHRNLLVLYRAAAGWMFWPLLAVVLPKWLVKLRAHRGQRRAYLRLLGRAVRDGLTGRLDGDHDALVAGFAAQETQTAPGRAARR